MNNWIKRNSSTILSVAGVIGVVATTVVAIKATPKALKVLEEAREEKGEDLTVIEVAVVAAPVYIPTVVIGAASIICILGANTLSKKNQASLVSAYALVDTSFKEYKAKVKELYGNDADEEVRTELAKDQYEKQDIPAREAINENLFYDQFSKRYFRATNETVLRAEYEMNRALNECGGATLNDYYELVGLDPVDYGEYLGWSSAQMYEMYWESWLYFNHTKTTMDDGTTCWIIEFTEPFPEFDEY